MPQMAPMNWLMIFTITTSSMIMMMSFTHYFKVTDMLNVKNINSTSKVVLNKVYI